MRPRSYLTCLLACSLFALTSCQTAPKVNWRVVSEEGFVDKQGQVIPYSDPKADEGCISPDDVYRLGKACRQGSGVPDVLFCSWDPPSGSFACSDEQLRGPEQLLNWSCLTSREWDRLLSYCHRKTQDN